MGQITAKAIARTAFLPGILPRLKALTKNSFSTLAYLMALLYRSVNLLPPGHPLTLPANQGRYGIRDVIVAAADNLVISRKNIDQIIIFFTILLGLALLIAQAVLMVVALVVETAWAAPPPGGLFVTPSPNQDIAFLLLDQVFGVPGIYGSAFDPLTPGGRAPFHVALHQMFALYSYAMLLVGVVIFLYYFVVTMFETAQSGRPFGQRFDTVWAPVRLVVALGLLIPFGIGLNSAQYLVLYAAKFGSGMATNGWISFNNTLVAEAGPASASPFGYQSLNNERIVITQFERTLRPVAVLSSDTPNSLGLEITEDEQRYRRSLIAIPKMPSTRSLGESLLLINSCMEIYRNIKRDDASALGELGPFLVRSSPIDLGGGPTDYIGPDSSPPLGCIPNPSAGLSCAPPIEYEQALEFFEYNNIVIRFGERSPDKYPDFQGNVKPLCGEITIPIIDLSTLNRGTGSSELSPAQEFQRDLFENYLTVFAYSPLTLNNNFGAYWAERELSAAMQQDGVRDPVSTCNNVHSSGTIFLETPYVNTDPSLPPSDYCNSSPPPDNDFFDYVAEVTKADMGEAYKVLYASALGIDITGPAGYSPMTFDGIDISIPSTIIDRGWGGAAIWYNRIAEINGMIVKSTNSIPKMTRMPYIMEEVANIKKREEANVPSDQLYKPIIREDDDSDDTADGTKTRNAFPNDDLKQRIATALYDLQTIMSDRSHSTESNSKVGPVYQIVNALLGTEGMFTMRENIQVHPLAQMTSLGRGMIDAAMRNMAISAVSGGLGGILESSRGVSAALQGISGFFAGFVSISLATGIVLYYIVPFMPFLYFFFAVVSWVKTIFEAMVGVPLWALAHLRIQGAGLPTQATFTGYLLILDIFIRPILIVFGLLAASAIFFAEAYLLHVVFDLVIENLAGADPHCLNLSGNTATQSTGCVISGDSNVDKVRGHIDTFFYTVLYTIIAYMLATSTFKLIDTIPGNILRWIQQTSTYTDTAPDPTQNMTRNMFITSKLAGDRVAGQAPDLFSSVGGAVPKP